MTLVGSDHAAAVWLEHLRARLAERYGGVLPPCMIGEIVDEAVRQFDDAEFMTVSTRNT